MADEPPKSRPEAPPEAPAPGQPAADESVYGGQWGQSGKQNPDDPAKADPRSDPPPERRP